MQRGILSLIALGLLASSGFAESSAGEEAASAVAETATGAQPVAPAADDEHLRELERRIDLLAAELEKSRTGGATDVDAVRAEPGLGPAASKIYRTARGVSIGGYGEVLYQDFDGTRQDGTVSDLRDRVDLLRVVLYTGYKFSDRILFNSETEFEHATTGEGDEARGEVSVEQAYLELKPWRNVGLRAGMLVVPLGFLNELHEPPIFYGARRPEVERVIIPTTWHEIGLGVFGGTGKVQWRAYAIASLNAAGFDAGGIQEGRQQGSESLAEDMALTGRLDYVGARGLTLGASILAGNSGQGALVDGQRLRGRVILADVHLQYEHRGFQGRVLYVHTSIGDAALINTQNGLSGQASVGSRQFGLLAETAYDLMNARPHGQWAVVPFVRYERLDTQDQVPAGFAKDPSLDRTTWTAGLSVKPLTSVVFKADYQWQTNQARTGNNQLNVAIGYLF